jgi:hypothetical protein
MSRVVGRITGMWASRDAIGKPQKISVRFAAEGTGTVSWGIIYLNPETQHLRKDFLEMTGITMRDIAAVSRAAGHVENEPDVIPLGNPGEWEQERDLYLASVKKGRVTRWHPEYSLLELEHGDGS